MAHRDLTVRILGDASSLQRALGTSDRAARGFNQTLGRLSIGFGEIVKGVVEIQILEKALEGLHEALRLGVDEFTEQAKLSAQTAAAIKSTGGVANVTAKQIDALSMSLSNLSGIDDEAIKAAENVLLAFTNIRNSAGKGNDIFTQATRSAADFAARTGRPIQTVASALGRALQDPAARLNTLSKAGLAFSKSQQEVIKSAEKTGGVLAAQKVLLKDIEERFGGAAKAAGQTLPGQLDILKERFKDLSGSILGVGEGVVARLLPSLTRGIRAMSDFTERLASAQGVRAKFAVVFDGIETLGRDLFEAARKQIAKIDWGMLAGEARRAAGQIASRIGSALRSVNWPAVVAAAGHGLGEAIVRLLNGLSSVIRRVNWVKVGNVIVDGIVVAIAATAKFLKSVDWGAVVKALADVLIATVKASAELTIGVGLEIAGLLGRGVKAGLVAAGSAIGHALDATWKFLESQAIKAALRIVEPFSHLPGFLGGGPFQAIKRTLEDELASVGAAGHAAAQHAGRSVATGIGEGIQQGMADVLATINNALAVARNAVNNHVAAARTALRETNLSPDTASLPAPGADLTKVTAAARKGITGAQRNTFFDNAIGRLLDEAQDGTIAQQIAKLKQIGGLITARISATRDVTRRLTLEQELLDQVTRPISALKTQAAQQRIQDSQDAFSALIAGLQVGVDRAAVTSSLQDDLRALDAEQTAVKARIRSVGVTTDLEEQLLGVQSSRRDVLKQIRANAVTVRNAAQFKAIGLTASGDTVVPGVKSLQAELGNVADSLQGSFLDTTKTKSLISHIREVLSGGLGAVGRDVRDKVKGILDDITNQLKNAQGDQTLFHHVATSKIIAGLGLDQKTAKALRERLSGVGAGFTVPQASPQFSSGGGGVVFNGPVTMHNHGVDDVAKFESQLRKRAARRPQVTRGRVQ